MKRNFAGFLCLGIGVCGIAATVSEPPAKEFGGIYVNLFNDMELAKKGELGASRIAIHHNGSLEVNDSNDNVNQNALVKARKNAQDQGWVVEEGLVEPSPAIATASSRRLGRSLRWLFGVPDANGKMSPLETDPNLSLRILKGIKASKSGTYQEPFAGYEIFADRVPFKHKECLGCHEGMKVGDTAAIAVFAFKKSPPPPNHGTE